MRRLTRGASHLAGEQEHLDTRTCRASARRAPSWRAPPLWPGLIQALVVCVLAIPLLCVSSPRSAAEAWRSTLRRPASNLAPLPLDKRSNRGGEGSNG